MSDERVAPCLFYAIHDKTATGMDRSECAACHGDSCPYVAGPAASAVCPDCFGTGGAMVGPELDMRDGLDTVCRRCSAQGRSRSGKRLHSPSSASSPRT
jgi:hypothetical protein